MATDREREVASQFQALGAAVVSLAGLSLPRSVVLEGPNQSALLRAGDSVRHAVSAMHKQHRFDVIEFPDRGALGFRSIQAKRAGLDFADVELVGRYTGPAVSCASAASAARGDGRAGSGLLRVVRAGACRLDDRPRRDGLRARTAERFDRRPHNRSAVSRPQRTAGDPLVTLTIPYHNLGAHLEATLESIAAQSYPALEVLVIDDGSTDAHSLRVFQTVQARYPRFRFLTQKNAGIGATRNRGLDLAQGDYFLPMDADNIAHPDMVRRFVTAMERNPDVAAMSSYFLAFSDDSQIAAGDFAYSYRPTGGPHVLAALENVYGDGNALFRTARLRQVGGFATDRDTSWEDWEVFVKLVNAGQKVDVGADYLFYYRHRPGGFSRATRAYRNHQRVLRRFVEADHIPSEDRSLLWNTLAGFHRQLEHLKNENCGLQRRLNARRYRWADWLHGVYRGVRSFLT